MAKKTLKDFPNLLKEWDFERNKNPHPETISFSSHDKAWWKCKKGHRWEALISNRARLGRNCPYCAHQLPIPGETDLESQYPNVCKELHPTKNGDLDTSKIMPGTHKEAWFVCPDCGHEYKTRIRNRVIGIGCPVCAMKKIVPGVNDFQTKHPNTAREWDTVKNGDKQPSNFSPNSDFEAWWICPIGHSYKTSIVSRSRGKQCPICQKANHTSFPEQAILYYVKKYYPDAINGYKDIFERSMELDIYIPSIKVGIEYDGTAWHDNKTNLKRDRKKYEICKKNDIYLIRVREKPYEQEEKMCDLLLVLKSERNSIDLDREIYHVLTSITTSYIASPYFKFDTWLDQQKQADNLRFGLQLMDVNTKRDRRKIQKYLTEFVGSLGEARPDLVEEWDYDKNAPLTPFNVKLSTNEKVWWKCKKCGHEWKTSIAERGGHDKTRCPVCALKISAKKHHDFVLRKKGSLAATHPHLLEKWDYEKNSAKPEEVVAGSGEKVWWKCKKCGYSWQATISHMSARNSKCPCCQNKVCVPGVNDIATLYPHLLEDWNYEKNIINPSANTAGGKRAFWKCHACGHEWEAQIYNRIKGVGCPKCAIERRKGNKFAKKKTTL